MLNIYSILDWCAGFSMFAFALIIYAGKRAESSRAYAIYSASTGMWALAMGTYIFVRPADYDIIVFLLRSLYWTGLSTAFAYHYFTLTYRNDIPRPFWKWLYVFLSALFFYVYHFTDTVVYGLTFGPRLFDRIPDYNWPGFIGFNVIFMPIVIAAFINLWKIWHAETDPEQRKNIRFLYWSGFTAWWPPITLAVTLPLLGNFDYYWIAPILSALWVFVASYGIFKYKLFNLRIVAVELIIVLLLIILFVNIFIPDIDQLFMQ